MVKSPIRLSGEIIQIGTVKVNEKLEIPDTFNVDIKPVYYKNMNKMVSDLTGIKTDDRHEESIFAEAIEKQAELVYDTSNSACLTYVIQNQSQCWYWYNYFLL